MPTRVNCHDFQQDQVNANDTVWSAIQIDASDDDDDNNGGDDDNDDEYFCCSVRGTKHATFAVQKKLIS